MKRLIYIMFLFFFISACNNNESQDTTPKKKQHTQTNNLPKNKKGVKAAILGRWRYKTESESGKIRAFTLKFLENNQFTLKKVTTSPKGKSNTTFNKGIWGTDSNILFMITQQEGTDAQNLEVPHTILLKHYNAYRIKTLDKNKLTFKSVSKKQTYQYKKLN